MSDDEIVPEDSTPPKKSKILPLILGLNTLLMAGVVVFLVKRPGAGGAPAHASEKAGEHAKKDEEGEAAAKGDKGEHDEPAEKRSSHGGEEEETARPTVKLDNFIIQLKTVDADRYVRVAFDLEVGSEADKSAVTARMSPIRDAVITFFADRTLDELRGGEAIDQTKATLMKRLREIVPGNRIRHVYITDFVVQ
jgi:flagellar FliL protein